MKRVEDNWKSSFDEYEEAHTILIQEKGRAGYIQVAEGVPDEFVNLIKGAPALLNAVITLFEEDQLHKLDDDVADELIEAMDKISGDE